jgi:hypothetical protein
MADQSSTQLRTDSIGSDAQLSPPAHVDQLTATHYPTFVNKQTYHGQPDALQRPTMVRAIDLDGMNIMTDDAHQLVTPETDELANSDPDEVVVPYVNGHVDMNLEFQPLTKHTPEQQAEQSLASAFRSATWTSMMGEVFPLPQPPSQTAPSFLSPDRPPEPISISQVFGTDWHCPSPTVLHIDYSQHLTIPMSGATCPKWKRSNEILSKIFTSRCSGTNAVKPIKDNTEASFLYLCIKHGWNSMSPDQWMQSPTLSIIKQLDDLLFSHQSNTKRFAIAYAILKLLKVCYFVILTELSLSPKHTHTRIYFAKIQVTNLLAPYFCAASKKQFYLNATKEELDKVPSWLRPRYVLHKYTHTHTSPPLSPSISLSQQLKLSSI